MSIEFRTQYSPNLFDRDSFDDGDEVDGYMPGMAENPGILLQRLEAGAMVGVRLPDVDYGQGNYDDFFDTADRLQDLMYDDPGEERESVGGPIGPDNPSVDKNLTETLPPNPSTPPATPPASTES